MVPDVNIVPVNISYEKVSLHKFTCDVSAVACNNVTVYFLISLQVVDSGYTSELLVRFFEYNIVLLWKCTL